MIVAESRSRLAGYGVVTLLAAFAYFYGLDSQYIPKNGDEYPYEHITRLTARSGHLLPLQSQLEGMRNTKPPMLVWQGIASTDGGRDWTLWHLRYPSVIYTLLTALMVFLLARKLSGRVETGFLATLSYLAFFSTYRYGRPFLTNPPEVFWLFLPFFALLYWRPAAFESRFLAPLALGIGIGIGLLYKSFALVAPVTLGLAWWYLHQRTYGLVAFLKRDAWKVAVIGTIALATFGLWFLLDPDPRAIWNEFVLHENMGKINPQGGYLANFFWGSGSVWSLALDYPLNAGLLVFPVAVLFFVAFTRRRELDDAEKLLWIWVLSLFLVFCLPSQRSGRYLLSAMPALAILLALNWERVSRKAFVASLIVAGVVIGLIAYLAVRLEQGMPDARLYSLLYWALLAAAVALALAALVVPKLTRPCTLAVVFLAFLSFAAFLRPFDGPLGNYSAELQRQAQGKVVGVPCRFRADFEGYRFVFPGAEVQGYRDSAKLSVAELGARFPLFVIQAPLEGAACANCKVLGQRLELRGRQTNAEMQEMLRGKVVEHLFARELLIDASGAAQNAAAVPARESCR